MALSSINGSRNCPGKHLLIPFEKWQLEKVLVLLIDTLCLVDCESFKVNKDVGAYKLVCTYQPDLPNNQILL